MWTVQLQEGCNRRILAYMSELPPRCTYCGHTQTMRHNDYNDEPCDEVCAVCIDTNQEN